MGRNLRITARSDSRRAGRGQTQLLPQTRLQLPLGLLDRPIIRRIIRRTVQGQHEELRQELHSPPDGSDCPRYPASATGEGQTGKTSRSNTRQSLPQPDTLPPSAETYTATPNPAYCADGFFPIGRPQVIFRYIHGPHHPGHQPLDPPQILPLIRPKILPHLPNHPRKISPRNPLLIPPIKLGRPRAPLARHGPSNRISASRTAGIKRLHLLGPRAIEERTIFLLSGLRHRPKVDHGTRMALQMIRIGHSGLPLISSMISMTFLIASSRPSAFSSGFF